MIFVAVNFHYVQEAPPPSPCAIFPVTPSGLAEQVALLTASFEPVSRDELIDAVAGGKPLPDRACMFTFDDGLRQQYELALPVFERAGCPVVFFVPGRPLAEGRALNVHRIHHLREELGDDALLELLAPFLDESALTGVDPAAAGAMYRYDTPQAARVKYLLNVGLGPRRSEEIVAAVFGESFGDETSFVRDLYMRPEQVADLERRGMLGAHAHSHLPLARLDGPARQREFTANLRALEAASGSRPRIVSYPYGNADAVDRTVAAAAAQAGLTTGFTMERAFNRSVADPLLLARLDCVDAPGGRKPLFRPDDPLAADAELAPTRTRYLDEASLTSEAKAAP